MYELQRRSGIAGTPVTVRTAEGSAIVMTDAWALPMPGAMYSYRIRSLGLGGARSRWSAWRSYTFGDNPCAAPTATRGTTHEVRVFLAASSDLLAELEAELPASEVAARLFGDANSAAAFIAEQSVGYSATRFMPRVRINGSIHGNRWHSLDHPRAHYQCTSDCRSIGDMKPMRDELVADGIAANDTPVVAGSFEDLEPGVLYLYIFAFEGAGGATGGPRIVIGHGTLMGETPLYAQAPYKTVAHEFGHAMGMKHAGLLDCGGLPPAPLHSNLRAAGCTVESYGSIATIMSSGTAHASVYSKWKTGTLGGNVVWIDASANPDPGMIELYQGADSIDVDLYDSSSTYAGGVDKMVFLKLEDGESAYVLDYRRAVGFNAEEWFGSWWRPAQSGVRIMFRPGRSLEVGDSEILEIAGLPVKIVGSSVADAARRLRISVVEDHGHWVRVRIERTVPNGCGTAGACGSSSPRAECRPSYASGDANGYCDAACVTYGDCCDDYELACMGG